MAFAFFNKLNEIIMEADRQSVKDEKDSGGNRNFSVNGKTCLVLYLYHSLVFCLIWTYCLSVHARAHTFCVYFMLKFLMYFCLDGHQDNVMCLRETDWLTTVNNREISLVFLSTLLILSCIRHNIYVNGEDVICNLHIPSSFINQIIAELDYQSNLKFTKYVEPTIEYNYPNEYWLLISLC